MKNAVDIYIEKQRSPQNEICQHLHKLIVKTFPNIKEEMKWGVPAFGNGLFYIVALKDHVNLGFLIKNLDKKALALFDGGGKETRHLAISSLKDIDQKRIVDLLKMVKEKE